MKGWMIMMQGVSEAEGRKSRQYILDDLDLPGKVGSNLGEESWSFSPLPFFFFLLLPCPTPSSCFHVEETTQVIFSHLSWTLICKWGISLLLISRGRGNKRLPEEGSWELRKNVERWRHSGGKYCFDFISRTTNGDYKTWWHYSLVVKGTEMQSPWVWGLELEIACGGWIRKQNFILLCSFGSNWVKIMVDYLSLETRFFLAKNWQRSLSTGFCSEE